MKERRDVFTELFSPLPLPDCPPPAGGGGMWLPPQAHVRSNLQHKYKSSTEAQNERDFKTSWHVKLPGLDICDFSDIFGKSPVALGVTVMNVCGKKKKKKKNWCRPGLTASLTCSTERRCTEYLWLWTSCEFFFSCHHRCVEGISCRRGCVLRGTSAVYIKLFGVMSWWTAAASLAHQKHRHTRYKYFADVTVAQSSTPDSRRRT